MDAHTIKLPAGLIDTNEAPTVAAQQEFQEETGYIINVVNVLPASYLSLGLTNESAFMVWLEVAIPLQHNLKVHNNQIQSSGLEESKKDHGLKNLLLSMVESLEALDELQIEEGVKVFVALYLLVLEMSMGEN